MQAAIKQLEETAIVMAGIQSRQAAVLRDHGEWPEQHEKAMRRHDDILHRIELNLAEATDKLNALINIVDDRRRRS